MQISWNGRVFNVCVIRASHDRNREIFDAIGRNKTVIVESNRPFLALKKLNNWDPRYKIRSGKFNSPGFDGALIKALDEGIAKYEKEMDKYYPFPRI